MELRRLTIDDVGVVALIDRSEHVDVEYVVVDGHLGERPVTMADIPAWEPVGEGPHSLAAKVEFCRQRVADGAALLAAYEGDELLGVAVVDPRFDGLLAWLAFLHVSRPHRRRGVASALWNEAVDLALAAGAGSLYVSAVPAGSAVGFYRHHGCRLADPVHPLLFAKEPDDIHLLRPLP